jgi:hypothetical protein
MVWNHALYTTKEDVEQKLSAPVEKSSSFASLMSSTRPDSCERGTQGQDWRTNCPVGVSG